MTKGMIVMEKCEDPKCKYYKKPLVDRGYGYPVCQSNTGSLHPKPMNKLYKNEHKKD